MFNPQPKPVKKPKSNNSLKKVSSKKNNKCSDGSMVSQQFINSKLSKLRKSISKKIESKRCEAYPQLEANDLDHTISQKRCKHLGKSELIWDVKNMSISSREAHIEWENFASGEFEDHNNVIKRMLFVKKHDPEMFEKRYQRLSNYKIMIALKK